ncbi:MAG: hypothetical protein HKN76_21690 [Saprospiraceae bacterium]|nr:hypothetical protein [Saprospiraceae bacterium]
MVFLLFLLVLSPSFHPLYLSTVEIEIRADRSWSGKMRIFYDDFEDALQNAFGARPNLDQKHINLYREQISNYLNSHLIIWSQSKGLTFSVASLLRTADVITLNIDGHDPWPDQSMITNDLLMELFGSQKNVMTFKLRADIRTVAFTKNHASQEIHF